MSDKNRLPSLMGHRPFPESESEPPEEWKGLLIGNPFREIPPQDLQGLILQAQSASSIEGSRKAKGTSLA